MKKVFFTLIFFVAVSLHSCEKDRCWRCVVTTRTTSNDSSFTPDLFSVGIDTCSLSEQQMNALRKSKTRTVTETVDGVSVTSVSTCNCVVISYL